MRFLINETVKSGSVIANSVNVNYPVNNVLDSRLSRIFKTADTITTAEIVFDAGSAVKVDSIAIANHNISSGVTTLKVQGNSTDVWTSPSVDETLTHSSGVITKQFTGGSYRYWRVQIIDAGNSDAFISIGRIFLADSFTAPNISPVIGHSRVSNSVKSISVSGQSYGDKRYFNSVINVKWPKINHTEKSNLIEQLETIDITDPFFVTFDEDCIDLGSLYVTIDTDGLHFNLLSNPAYYEASIGFREEV